MPLIAIVLFEPVKVSGTKGDAVVLFIVGFEAKPACALMVRFIVVANDTFVESHESLLTG